MQISFSRCSRRLFAGLVLAVSGSLALSALGAEASYKILKTADHDPSLFTQGLIVDGGDLIESAGLYGHSRIVRYRAATGRVLRSTVLPASVFAEGLEQYNGSLYLLTWRENTAFRLDPHDFSIQQQFPLETEGWGLTHNGEHFIQSDGSATLYFRSSETFKVEKKLIVHDGARRCSSLNELEYAHGLVWANVFMTSTILAISPDSGQAVYSLDLAALAAPQRKIDFNNVLNGIAYDPEQDAFWITGKRWNKRYLIKIFPPE